MSVTDWEFPGATAGNRPIGDNAWADSSNVTADDGSNATNTQTSTVSQTQGLAATDFDFSEIPDDATIDGIEIRFEISADIDSSDPNVPELRLIGSDDVDGALNRFSDIGAVTTSPTVETGGGATELWGETRLSPADIKDVDFGFLFHCGIDGFPATEFRVDFMQMRVFWSVHKKARVAIGSGLTTSARLPIFRSSAGAFYHVRRVSSTSIDVAKTIDPHTVAWADQDTGNNPSGSTRVSIDCVQSGDVIHMAYHITEGGDNTYRYSSFDMSTDLWDVVDETIETLTDTIVIAAWINIGVRDDGDIVVAYIGISDANMGDDKARVDVDVRTAGPDTWSGPTGLDAGGDNHYGNPNVIKSPLTDDMHILWGRTTNSADPPAAWEDSQARTLNPADGLNAVQTDAITTLEKLQGFNYAISYDDGPFQRIVFGGSDDLAGSPDKSRLILAIGVEDGNDDFGFGITPAPQSIALFPEPIINGNASSVSLAVDIRNFLHVVYTNDVLFDHYYTKSEDDGATWDTPIKIEGGIVSNGNVSLSVLVYRAAYELFWTYNDAGTWYVNSMEIYPFEPSWRDQPYTVLIEELR